MPLSRGSSSKDDDAILLPHDLPPRVTSECCICSSEPLAAVVVERARTPQVDGYPARLTEDGEAEDSPPFGEVCAKGVRGADGDFGRNRPEDARRGTVVRGDDVVAGRELGAERDMAPDRKRAQHDAGAEDEQDEPTEERAR